MQPTESRIMLSVRYRTLAVESSFGLTAASCCIALPRSTQTALVAMGYALLGASASASAFAVSHFEFQFHSCGERCNTTLKYLTTRMYRLTIHLKSVFD